MFIDKKDVKRESFILRTKELNVGMSLFNSNLKIIGIVAFLFVILIIKLMDYVDNTAMVGFLGSVVGGLLSGGMTLIGVMLAFRLEKNQSRIRHQHKIVQEFNKYIITAGLIFELIEKIHTHATSKDVKRVDNTNYSNVIELIENLKVTDKIDTYMQKKDELEKIDSTLNGMLFIFYDTSKKYWDGIKTKLKGSDKNQQLLDAVILNDSKQFQEVYLSAYLLITSIKLTEERDY